MKTLQKGFTVVELMVAMLLGLILSGAALQLFLTNQKTFALQEALSSLEEDGQMILRYISADIRNAGRGNAVIGTIDSIIHSESLDGGRGGNDTVVVNYLSEWDCQGTDLTLNGAEPEGRETQSTYFVNNETLFCSSDQSAGQTALLSGVESFQVLYGVDRTPDGVLGVTNYVTAAGKEAEDLVVSIRLALLLRSAADNLSVPTSGGTFQVLDETHETETADRALRRVFTTTIQMRNYNWEAI